MSEVGTQLRALREGRGVGLREMARRVRVTASYLCEVERGRKAPSEAVVRRLARELRHDPELLLLWCGVVPPDVVIALRERPAWLERIRREG